MLNSIEDLLKREERLQLTPYRCTEGKLTIGFGWNLDACPMRQDEAVYRLQNDIGEARHQAMIVFGDDWSALNDVRQAVVISMIFQLGFVGFNRFRMTIGYIRTGDYQQAAINMLKSKWATQTPNRAKRHAEMMRTGQWPKEW
jgi:lysozyme